MFSNRAFGWKLAAALAVVALLGIRSSVLGSSIHPSLWRCAAQPARWDGAALWLTARVTASDVDGFEIEGEGVRARVAPAAAVAPGDVVDLTGTFRSSGPIQLKEVRKVRTGFRTLQEVVSVAVLALILLNLLRHFAFRSRMILVEGAD